MANPSLKAKIEAAKSALKENQNDTPTSQEPDDLPAPKTFPKPTSESKPASRGTTEAQTNFEPDAATLDARITSLEQKLAENQRDLYTLLGKIREITRLQNHTTKKPVPRNTRPKEKNSDNQSATGYRDRKIAITLAALTGITLGTSFFLATDSIDQHLTHLRTWGQQFVDFISAITR